MKFKVNLPSNFSNLFRSQNIRIISMMLVCISLVTSFQNCGRAGMDSAGLDAGLTLSSEVDLKSIFGTDANKVSALPFAFESNFDQITYNSCASNTAAQSKSFFTIRAGSYSNGGVKVSQNFINSIISAPFSPIDGFYRENQIKRYLAYSPENQNVKLQMAVRQISNLNSVLSAGALTEGISYLNLGHALTDDRVMVSLINFPDGDQLANLNNFIIPTANYFPLASSYDRRRIEGSLSFNSSPQLESQVRTVLSGISGGSIGASYLSLSYNSETPTYKIKSPQIATVDEPVTTAYGKFYSFTFNSAPSLYTQALGAASVTGLSNLVSSVQEIELVGTGASIHTWNCGRKYVVMRREDVNANPALCPSESIDSIYDPNYVNEAEIVRRHLPAGDWDINTRLGCAVPRSADYSCYPPDNIGIAYDQSIPCFQETNPSSPSQGTVPRCANHITICVRQ